MEKIIVQGGQTLRGTLRVQGSKNAALPILAACVLVNGVCEIRNCPDLSDVRAAVRILRHLGCAVERGEDSLRVDARTVFRAAIPHALMREMRSSIVFLGSVLSRTGRAALCTPGGCEIGARPIDLHLSSLRALGARIDETNGALCCTARGGLRGATIRLRFPSVGATENILLAAAAANGTTTLYGAAREPEIGDLIRFLNACGARIRDLGAGTLKIEGVPCLHGCTHCVIPDRIAAVTYMAAAAVTGGDVTLTDIVPAHLACMTNVFEQAGCRIEEADDRLHLRAPERLRAVRDIRTAPYPGFPTDAQAAVMAALATADGVSTIEETIFENRFHHVCALQRMGADITVKGCTALLRGVARLHGAAVSAVDLRAGAAMVVAGLGAQGETVIDQIQHIDRGYEKIEACLQTLGARIERSADSGSTKPEQQFPLRFLPLRYG